MPSDQIDSPAHTPTALERCGHGSRRFPLLSIVLSLTACTTVAPQAEHIVMTRKPADVAQCRMLGQVAAYPPYIMPNDDYRQMKNAAVLLNADTVLVLNRFGVAKGMAYQCGQKTRKTRGAAEI
jgi:hypothetical protein